MHCSAVENLQKRNGQEVGQRKIKKKLNDEIQGIKQIREEDHHSFSHTQKQCKKQKLK